MTTYKTFESWDHQKKVEDLIDSENINVYALFHDMGTGKTKTASEIYRIKCEDNGRWVKMLIICPLVVLENWKRELLTHTYIPEEKIQIVDGCTKPNGRKLKNPQKKLRLEQINNPTAEIFIINTDNVSNVDVWDEVLKLGIEMLVVDESHRFKANNGKRTKALHKLSQQPQCRYKFILTGSPILQSALDLWSQFYILDPKILGANYFSFRSQYFYDKNANMPSHIHFPNFVPKDKNYFKIYGHRKTESMEGLNELIYRHADRVMKDEVLDLPPRTYQTLEVPFTKDQRRIYESMRDDLVAFIDDIEVKVGTTKKFQPSTNTMVEVPTVELPDLDDLPEMMKADLAIVKTLRLQQLICGIFTGDNIKLIDTNRIKILEELLTELSTNKTNKIIIWSIFTPTYQQLQDLCTKLGINFVMLTGQQSRQEKQDNVDAFNNDPKVQCIIANQGAGGTGVNLTAANYEIYYSRSFVLEHDLQADARAYRGGQKRSTTRIDLITPDTIDSRIVEALAAKRDHAEDILEVKSKELGRSELLGMV